MTMDGNEDKHLFLAKVEEFSPVSELNDDYSSNATLLHPCAHCDEDISDNDTEQSKDSYLISTIKYKEESCDDSVDIPYDPKEWLISDSITGRLRPPRQNEFLYLLLENSRYSSYVSWLDRNEGLFKIHLPKQVAQFWTKVKNRQTTGLMDYDTFSRGIRYYYKSGSMIKTNRKYTFRFKMSETSAC